MLKQFWCWLCYGHEKRYLYTDRSKISSTHAYICIRCDAVGFSDIKPPIDYAQEEKWKYIK